jgi:hypothetical protein
VLASNGSQEREFLIKSRAMPSPFLSAEVKMLWLCEPEVD